MSVCACIDLFKSFLEGSSDTSFFSSDFIALRAKDGEIISGINNIVKYFKNKKIEDVSGSFEDSHYLLFYSIDGVKYISKARFDSRGFILSLVEEIYDETKENVVLEIEYDGTNYNGMQKQAYLFESTIQGQIELALKKMLNRDVNTIISSRTDSGVHARGNTIQFESFGISPDRYIYALNNILPDDIRIKNAYIKSQLFHVRYDVIEKSYVYIIDTSEFSVFKKDYVYYTKIKDIDELKKELKSIIGTHDFVSFCKGENDNTIRTIYETDVIENGTELILSFRGNGFLHNMIRFIVGAALDRVNNNKPSLLELIEKKDKNLTPKLAPASGLYLTKIKY